MRDSGLNCAEERCAPEFQCGSDEGRDRPDEKRAIYHRGHREHRGNRIVVVPLGGAFNRIMTQGLPKEILS